MEADPPGGGGFKRGDEAARAQRQQHCWTGGRLLPCLVVAPLIPPETAGPIAEVNPEEPSQNRRRVVVA
jgi:hypothetical protein